MRKPGVTTVGAVVENTAATDEGASVLAPRTTVGDVVENAATTGEGCTVCGP